MSELREDAHRRLFEVNYFAATFMAQAFLEALRASSGTHLVVTSVAGFAPLRYRSAYAASKHAPTGFFGSLRAEEEAYGVHVALAVPSFVATNPGQRPDAMGLSPPGAAKGAFDSMTVESAAKAILRGVQKRRHFIPVGRVAWMSVLLMRLSPKFYHRIMSRSVPQEDP